MKLFLALFLAAFSVITDDALAQPAQDNLLVIGHAGEVSLLSPENPGATTAVVLLNGEIVRGGEVDCDQTPNHPQCQTLSWLQGTGGQVVNRSY